MNARNRSTKSGFIASLASKAPDLLAEPPHLEHALSLGDLHPEFQVVPVRVGSRLEPPHDDPR
jgi:hypothetical protein